MHIYLIIPKDKILSPGGLLSDGCYGFYSKDGTVYLPQQVSAYIFAIAEDPDKKAFYFGPTAFITTPDNHLSLQLQAAAPENFEKFIQQAGGDKGLSAQVRVARVGTPGDSSIQQQLNFCSAWMQKNCPD